MRVTLKIWRQTGRKDSGKFVSYPFDKVNPDMSVLECLDVLNEGLIGKGEEPVAFEHDCREGICGSCGFMINGVAHGPLPATTVCQLHMRHFKDGDVLYLEPWRARAFPVVKDLVVDRSAFDRIIAAGGFISVVTGSAPDGNTILVPKKNADLAMDAAACIGCGACVAACPNASAALFVADALGQAATQAPHPMHAAASIARSASRLGTRSELASGALPVRAVMNPPAWMIRSNAPRSTTRSLITGNARVRHGSIHNSTPSGNERMCSWHVVVARCGPCGRPLITMPHAPQIPSRQSWSNAIGSSLRAKSCWFKTSSSSRNDMS